MKSLPLWIIAGTLALMVFFVFTCAGGFVVMAIMEQQRREELLEKEPWRKFMREPYKYAP